MKVVFIVNGRISSIYSVTTGWFVYFFTQFLKTWNGSYHMLSIFTSIMFMLWQSMVSLILRTTTIQSLEFRLIMAYFWLTNGFYCLTKFAFDSIPESGLLCSVVIKNPINPFGISNRWKPKEKKTSVNCGVFRIWSR